MTTPTDDEEPDVLVDIEVGGRVKQVAIPADLWARISRRVEETGTPVSGVIEQAIIDYLFVDIVRAWRGQVE